MIFPPRLRDQVWKNNSQKGGKNLSKLPNSQVSQDVLKKPQFWVLGVITLSKQKLPQFIHLWGQFIGLQTPFITYNYSFWAHLVLPFDMVFWKIYVGRIWWETERFLPVRGFFCWNVVVFPVATCGCFFFYPHECLSSFLYPQKKHSFSNGWMFGVIQSFPM